MQKITRFTSVYYILSVIIALGICAGLLAILDWPSLAEIPLSICVFIQFLYVSKTVLAYIHEKETSFDENIAKIRTIFYDLKSQDEEVSY